MGRSSTLPQHPDSDIAGTSYHRSRLLNNISFDLFYVEGVTQLNI